MPRGFDPCQVRSDWGGENVTVGSEPMQRAFVDRGITMSHKDRAPLPLADRTAAGRMLAAALAHYRHRDDTLVLALPRGGIPVACEVAAALHAPVDVLIVRKLGAPSAPEVAVGAIASGGVRFVNDATKRSMGVTDAELKRVEKEEAGELKRREALYRGGRPPAELSGKTVVLVDDGLATGATMTAAVEAARLRGAAAVVVAVPVGSSDACAALAERAPSAAAGIRR